MFSILFSYYQASRSQMYLQILFYPVNRFFGAWFRESKLILTNVKLFLFNRTGIIKYALTRIYQNRISEQESFEIKVKMHLQLADFSKYVDFCQRAGMFSQFNCNPLSSWGSETLYQLYFCGTFFDQPIYFSESYNSGIIGKPLKMWIFELL